MSHHRYQLVLLLTCSLLGNVAASYTSSQPIQGTDGGSEPKQQVELINLKEKQGSLVNDSFDAEKLIMEEYLQTIKLPSKDAEGVLKKGIIHHRLGDEKSALANFNRAIQLQPDLARAYLERGILLSGSDLGGDGPYQRTQKALPDFNRAIQLNPNFAEAYLERGLLLVGLTPGGPLEEDIPQIIGDFSQAAKLSPKIAAQALYGLITVKESLLESNDFTRKPLQEKMLEMYEYDLKFYDAYDYYSGRSREEDSSNQFKHYSVSEVIEWETEKAEIIFKKSNQIILQDAHNSLAYYRRGLAQLKLNQLQSAIDDFNKAIDNNLNDSNVYNDRATVYFKAKNYVQSVKDASQAIVLNPNLADAYLTRGFAQYKLGNGKEAFEDANRVISLDPELLAAYTLRWAARDNNGENKETKDKDYSKAWYSLPCLWGCGSSSSTEAQVSPDALYQRSLTLVTQGYRQDAIRVLRRAITLFQTGQGSRSKFQDAKKLLRRLEQA